MKKIKIILLSILIILSFQEMAFAQEAVTEDTYEKLYWHSGAGGLEDSLPSEAQEILNQLGIDNADFNSIFKADFKSILRLFYKIACKNIDGPLKLLFKVIGVLILTSIVKILIPESSGQSTGVNILLSSVIVLSVLAPISNAIVRSVTAIESSCDFMKLLIPVFAGIIAMSGNPLMAFSYNSLTLFMAEGICTLSSNTVISLMGAYTALCAVTGVASELNLNGVADLFKKTAITVLSVCAALFSAALSLKGIMAGAADNLMSRGIKLAISTAIPIVGGALSEAYSSIIGSLALLKSAVGMFCIMSVLAINIPVIIELASYIACFKISSAVAALFNNHSAARIIDNICSTFTILNVTVIFEGVVFIISSAIILSLRTLI